MTLSVYFDAGNSRLKWAVAHDRDTPLTAHGVLAYARPGAALTDDELDAIVGALAACGEVTQAWLVSVAGDDLARQLEAALARRFRCPLHRLQVRREFAGLRVAYARVENLGADRWAALLGAGRVSGYPCVVADLGTAVTVDAVDAHGQHLGGAIAPGCLVQRRALLLATSRIRGDLAAPAAPTPFARDTGLAVGAGVDHAIAGLVDRACAAARRALASSPAVADAAAPRAAAPSPAAADADASVPLLVTGGDAARLAPLLPPQARHVADLVLEGLRLAAALSPRPGGGTRED